MHQALYRKYRPQTFSDVCGQEHISQTLKSQIAEKRWSHAYLFTGSRGTGKTSSAKILSKAVNCLNPVDGDPCNECEICKGIDSGAIMDVVEIDAASNRGVDDMRNLRDQIEYSPAKAKYRVYIIDEVHMLTKEAFNALLKTLEEPPAHAVFILATTEVWAIPATILSRCQRYDFNRISAEVISDRIKFICDKENISIEDNAAMLISKLADGGMRDALSMLDLCAGNSKNITEAIVADSAGLIGKDYLFDLVDLLEKKDCAEILNKLDELYSSSCDMERLMNELIGHYRDLLIAKTSDNYRNLITATNENLDRLASQAKKTSFENILYCVGKFTDCLDEMKRGASKRITVETTLISLCTDRLDSSVSAILKRLGNLEDKLAYGVPVQAAPAVNDTENNLNSDNSQNNADLNIKQEKTVVSEVAAPPLSDELTRFKKWPEVLEVIKSTSSMIYAVLSDSVAYTKGNLLLIDAPNPTFTEMVRNNESFKKDIKAAALKVSGIKYRLGPYNKQTAAVVTIKNDPLDELINNNSDFITIEE